MSPAEIVSRIHDQIYLFRLRFRHSSTPAELPPEPPGSYRNIEFNVGSIDLDMSSIANDFSELLEGTLTYGGEDWHFDEGPLVWHREHTTLRDWPQQFFNTINYRPGNPTGDARRTWEPARLQQLVALAVRARDLNLDDSDSMSELAITMIERQLVSWWKYNPYLHGIHYVSAMECGLRCVALAYTASMLESRGRLSSVTRAIVLSILHQHAEFIRQRISSHSSAGNHTLAECAGLIFARLVLRERDEIHEDEAYATQLFVREFDRQVNDDGGGLEQATWYHRFNVELAECVANALVANGRTVPDSLSNAIFRGGRFLKAIERSGRTIKLGDADDGYAVSPYYLGQWRHMERDLPVQHFKTTGVSIGQFGQWHLLVQYGPLGMAPAYGHGHADALNIVLGYGKYDVLVDSGTGAYGAECSQQRAKFRSCTSHNTVQVGDTDFAQVLSPFMWSHPYQCRLVHEESSHERMEIWLHLTVANGPGYVVRRYIRIEEGGLVVADSVTASSVTMATQRWHFPFSLVLSNDAAKGQLSDDGVTEPVTITVKLKSDENESANAHSVLLSTGQRSPAYGSLESVSILENQLDSSSEDWLLMQLTGSGASVSQSLVLDKSKIKARAMEFY